MLAALACASSRVATPTDSNDPIAALVDAPTHDVPAPTPIVPVPLERTRSSPHGGGLASAVEPMTPIVYESLAPDQIDVTLISFEPRTHAVPDGSARLPQIYRCIDHHAIRERIDRAALARCAEHGLARDPNLKGHVTLSFEVKDGVVVAAEVTESELGSNNYGVHACLERAARAWSFPSLKGPLTIAYPVRIGW